MPAVCSPWAFAHVHFCLALNSAFCLTPFHPPGSNSEVTTFERSLTLRLGRVSSTKLPWYWVNIRVTARTTLYCNCWLGRALRRPQGPWGWGPYVHRCFSPPSGPVLGASLMLQMDKWVRGPRCAPAASLGRRRFCFAVWLFLLLWMS